MKRTNRNRRLLVLIHVTGIIFSCCTHVSIVSSFQSTPNDFASWNHCQQQHQQHDWKDNNRFPSATVKRRREQISLSLSSSKSSSSTSQQQRQGPKPIDISGWPMKFPAKEHCSKCGLCETTYVSHVQDACAFLQDGMSKVDDLEHKVHGRGRQLDSMVWSRNDNKNNDETADEGRFGVLHEPMTLARGIGMKKAQWTGVVTSIALSMLETNQVDAVVCIANNNNDSSEASSSWSEPQPILARTAEDVLRGRGVKPALAPSLRVLDDIKADPSIRRLLFCGVGCAVQAFRAVQDDLNLDQVYVLGTNCVDNSPTPQAARNFIQNGVQIKLDNSDDKILGYEFMQDYRVHVKTENNYFKKPYFCLPGSIAKQSIAPSCLACFDYTNALADVVVGYMGAPLDGNEDRMDKSWQTLTIRNERGAHMVATAATASTADGEEQDRPSRLEIGPVAKGTGSHEKIALATTMSDFIVQSMMDESTEEKRQEGMPQWMGEFMAFVLKSAGPKGVAFARYSIDYHILRNYLHVLDEWGGGVTTNEADSMAAAACARMPRYAQDIVKHYLEDKQFQQLQSKILAKHAKQ